MSDKNTANPQQQVINQIYERLKDKKLSHELNMPCETILMLIEKHFKEFAARIAAFNPYPSNTVPGNICLFCGKIQGINAHENDCMWIEAKRIIAAMDKRNENT